MKYIIVLILISAFVGGCDKENYNERAPTAYSFTPRPKISDKLKEKAKNFAIESKYSLSYKEDSIEFYDNRIGSLPPDTTGFTDVADSIAVLIVYSVYKEAKGMEYQPSRNADNSAWLNAIYSGGSYTRPTNYNNYGSYAYIMPDGVNPFSVITTFNDTTGGVWHETGRIKFSYNPENKRLFPL